MNIFSKAYSGKFYVLAVVLSAIASALTSDAVVGLGWEWVGPAAIILTGLAFILQQFTSVGDSE